MLREIVLGLFRWKHVAPPGGGASEYVFEQFQNFPTSNLIDGRGYHVRGQYRITEPALVVTHPVRAPFDPFEILSGEPDLLNAGGEGGLTTEQVTP